MNDKINSPGDDNLAMSNYWNMVGTIVTGAEAMRKAGEAYLPKFPNESDEDYNFRRTTAKFTNVYRDIIEGLSSKPFAQQLTINEGVSSRLNDLVEDIDGKGNHLHVFAANSFFNGINSAIDWILVEYPNTDGSENSIADEQTSGVRPYWVQIPAKNILEVKTEKAEGVYRISYARILEPNKSGDRIRVFTRLAGAVTWALWEESKEGLHKGQWVIINEGIITIGFIPLVPFVTGRRKGNTWQFFPPMQDAADLQVELYQQEASLKYAKTMACFPMLTGNGVMPPMDEKGDPLPVQVGPHAVLYAPPNTDGNSGQWQFIETSAESLKFLAADIEKTKLDLRELGRQPLTAQSGNLTRITTAVAAEKGNSAVQMWALSLKDALETALYYTSLWLGQPEDAEVNIFTDFDAGGDDDNAPETLLKMRSAGDLSQKTLYAEFKRRGILSAEFDHSQEIKNQIEEMPGQDDLSDLTAAIG